jgi:flagellar basal body P-ring formation protein FlgA
VNHRLQTIVLLVTVFVLSVTARAAELRLRPQCSPQTSVVTLGDVAEIFSADARQADTLKRLELFPAATSDQPRVLRVREIQDMLAARGINLAEHRFSGSSQVQITVEKKRADPEKPFNEQAAKRAEHRVYEAVLKYLQGQSGNNQPRTLQFQLTAAGQRAAATSTLPISVRGGNPPWSGLQQLIVSVETADGLANFPLDVRVSIPSSVVAAVHPLPRGAIIHSADITLVNGDASDDGEKGAFHTLAEVAGKQATRTIAEGKVITSDAVQAPHLVHRGDVVTVYARTAGIRIHTTARAKDDGALGDLVAIESLADRKSFTARVCGPRETEVFAQAAQAE